MNCRITKDILLPWTINVGRGYWVKFEKPNVTFRSNTEYIHKNGIYGKHRTYIIKLGNWEEMPSDYNLFYTFDYKFARKVLKYLLENPKQKREKLFENLAISKQEDDSLERVA